MRYMNASPLGLSIKIGKYILVFDFLPATRGSGIEQLSPILLTKFVRSLTQVSMVKV
jgi:hypothetical protein